MEPKYVYERLEEFFRAVKANKIKEVFYTQEQGAVSEYRYVAHTRLTAISTEFKVHLLCLDRAYDGRPVEDPAKIAEFLTQRHNIIQEVFSNRAPEVTLIPGLVSP